MKKFILSLFVGLFSFISFCSAGQVVDLLDVVSIDDVSLSRGNWLTLVDFGDDGDSYTVCFSYDGYNGSLQTGIGSTLNSQPGTNFTYWSDWGGKYVCFYKSPVDRYLNVRSNNDTIIYGNYFILNELLDYNIDVNYCVSNNLCPSTTFYLNDNYSLIYPVGYTYYINYSDDVSFDYDELNNEVNFNFSSSGNLSSGNFSSLYINDIRHESMPFIYVNIPEEFNRTYSTGINDFTIDIEGYNVDTEYIDGIIRTQNYKPSSEDFTNLVGLLAPYTKYLVFLLFVFVVWAWIKKPFKSKKL